MGKLSAESWWLGRVGLPRERGKTKNKSAVEPEKATIGVLAFEVGSLMSKTAQLWQSLGDDQIVWLRDEVLHMEGVRKLVSQDEDFLLGLALAEKMDSLGFLARSVARLGKRCDEPVLQRFEHVFAEAIKNDADLYGWEYAGKKMDRKVKKMESFVAAGGNLYQEMEVLAELEQSLRRMQGSAAADPSHQGSLIEFKQKVIWHRQEVKYLQEASLWNRSYDYAVCLLARSLFTIVSRISHVFGLHHNGIATDGSCNNSRAILPRSHSVHGSMQHSANLETRGGINRFSSGPLPRSGTKSRAVAIGNRPAVRHPMPPIPPGLPPPPGKRSRSRTKWQVSGGPFRGCMMSGSSPVLQSCQPVDRGRRRTSAASDIHNWIVDADGEVHCQDNLLNTNLSLYLFTSKRKLMSAPRSTLGAAGLALHYANVIIVIEKLAASPHLIGPDARDDLYNMLTTSIRASLRARLKSYAKNLACSIYDPNLAAEWNEALKRILEWMAPLAHDMLRWQSERNFEQQHLVSSTNVLLLQTLYFANQVKTEAAITELLVGLNYLWRYDRELNAKAILECLSSRTLDDCLNF